MFLQILYTLVAGCVVCVAAASSRLRAPESEVASRVLLRTARYPLIHFYYYRVFSRLGTPDAQRDAPGKALKRIYQLQVQPSAEALN